MFPKVKSHPRWRVTLEQLNDKGKPCMMTRDYGGATAQAARVAAEMLKGTLRVVKVESLTEAINNEDR